MSSLELTLFSLCNRTNMNLLFDKHIYNCHTDQASCGSPTLVSLPSATSQDIF